MIYIWELRSPWIISQTEVKTCRNCREASVSQSVESLGSVDCFADNLNVTNAMFYSILLFSSHSIAYSSYLLVDYLFAQSLLLHVDSASFHASDPTLLHAQSIAVH